MKNLQTILSKLLKVFRYGDQLQPERDWAILIVIGIILLATSVIYNVWLFGATANGTVISPQATTPPASTAAVTSVQDIFKQRATEEDQYQHTYHFVDPSLPSS